MHCFPHTHCTSTAPASAVLQNLRRIKREVVMTVAENDENEGDVSATGAENEENAENLGFGSRPLWLELSILWSGWKSLLGSHLVGKGGAPGDLERLNNQSTESIRYWHGSQHVQLESSWDECWRFERIVEATRVKKKVCLWDVLPKQQEAVHRVLVLGAWMSRRVCWIKRRLQPTSLKSQRSHALIDVCHIFPMHFQMRPVM